MGRSGFSLLVARFVCGRSRKSFLEKYPCFRQLRPAQNVINSCGAKGKKNLPLMFARKPSCTYSYKFVSTQLGVLFFFTFLAGMRERD
jgi:hypothetical protein